MNALERKLTNMVRDHKKKYGELPKYMKCTIRWNDDKEYVHDTIIAIIPFDGGDDDDDRIFFYCEDMISVLELLANIDFLMEDFDEPDDFYAEVDKFDTDDENSEDWGYLHRGEDFCIVDIEDFFDEL